MNAWTFFADLYAAFDAIFIGTIQTGANNLLNDIRPAATAAATCYLAVVLIMEILRPTGEPIAVVLRKCGFAVCVLAGLTVANYTGFFITFMLNSLPNELINAISGALPGDKLSPAAFDKVLGAHYAACMLVWKSIHGWSAQSFGTACVVGLDLVFVFLSLGIGFFVYMAQHVMLGVLIEIGPVMLLTLMFAYTARFFNAWFGHLISLVLAQVGIVAVLAVVMNFNTAQVQGILTLRGTTAFASDEFGQLHLLLESLVLSLSVPFLAIWIVQKAAAIGGGVAGGVAPILALATAPVGPAVQRTGALLSSIGGGSKASNEQAGMRSTRPAGRSKS